MIGKGTYGQVYRPAVKCFTDVYPGVEEYISPEVAAAPDKWVSKVFMSKTDAEDELSKAKVVSLVDPAHAFTLRVIESGYCRVPAIVRFRRGHHSYQIVSEYGGNDLDNAMFGADLLGQFLAAFSAIVNGVVTLAGNGLAHCDIKPANMLFNEIHGRCVLIDFGLMKRFRDMYIDFEATSTLDSAYPPYPPETTQVYALLRGQSISDPIQHGYTWIMNKTLNGSSPLVTYARQCFSDDAQTIQVMINELWNGRSSPAAVQTMMQKYAANKLDVYSMGYALLTIFSHSGLNWASEVPMFVKALRAALAFLDPVFMRRPCPATAALLWRGVFDTSVTVAGFFTAIEAAQAMEMAITGRGTGGLLAFSRPQLPDFLSRVTAAQVKPAAPRRPAFFEP